MYAKVGITPVSADFLANEKMVRFNTTYEPT